MALRRRRAPQVYKPSLAIWASLMGHKSDNRSHISADHRLVNIHRLRDRALPLTRDQERGHFMPANGALPLPRCVVSAPATDKAPWI